MVGLIWGKYTLSLLATASIALAQSAADRKFWDDKCKAKLGQQYYMVFDSNGNPTTTCRAPPYQGCYWGPYKDPKTGQDGCCGKGNGQFSTDPIATQEGGCCPDPLKYSFDVNANKGGCCAQGLHLTWDMSVQPLDKDGTCCNPGLVASIDKATMQSHCCPPGLSYVSDPATQQGDCCEPGKIFSVDAATQKGECCSAGQVYSVDAASGKGECCASGQSFTFDVASGKGGCCSSGHSYVADAASGKGDCCIAGAQYKIDPVTGTGGCCGANDEFKCDCKCTPIPDIDPKCPADNLKIIQNGGKKWKIFCGLINHGTNDISITPNIPSWGQCINNCAKLSNCVRAIYNANTKTCYLRSHGNKDDAATADVYSSAHLVEDDPVVPEPATTDPEPADPAPTDPAPTDIGDPKHCPEVGGRIVDVGGVTYEIQCTHGISEGVPDYKTVTAADIGECMNFCTADPKCQGVNFYDDGQSDGCVMVEQHEYPAAGNVDPSTKLISAVPIKKR
ncbi:hypothetical protein F4779DRAFT_632874 [Xylariaceae sp. FL0662B]|nr:hypothetical protein F4779DRAFT_632874 [Xylariaceae sp. FL0662B]